MISNLMNEAIILIALMGAFSFIAVAEHELQARTSMVERLISVLVIFFGLRAIAINLTVAIIVIAIVIVVNWFLMKKMRPMGKAMESVIISGAIIIILRAIESKQWLIMVLWIAIMIFSLIIIFYSKKKPEKSVESVSDEDIDERDLKAKQWIARLLAVLIFVIIMAVIVIVVVNVLS